MQFKGGIKINGKAIRGEFPKGSDIIDPIKKALREAAKLTSSKTASELAELARQRLKEQAYASGKFGYRKYKDLSIKWTRFKAEMGLDPRFLIASEDYLNSIKARRVGKSEYRFWIGPDLDAIHKPKYNKEGLSYRQLLRIHEFGYSSDTMDIPARPFWGPFRIDMEMELSKRIPITFSRLAKALVREYSPKGIWKDSFGEFQYETPGTEAFLSGNV